MECPPIKLGVSQARLLVDILGIVISGRFRRKYDKQVMSLLKKTWGPNLVIAV